MIAIFLSPIYILINIYVVRWMLRWMGACHHLFQSTFFRAVFIGLYIFLASTLLSGFLIRKPVWLHRLLKKISNYFLGTFLYILMVIALVDISRLLLKYVFHASWIQNRTAFVITGGLCMVLIMGISLYGIIHAWSLKVTSYEIQLDKHVDDMDSLKIVLVADTHFGYSTSLSYVKQLVASINKQHPDMVCIAGDIFDNEYDAIQNPDKIIDILKNIQSAYGVYACWGNHDLNEPILAGFTFKNADNNYEDPRMKQFLQNAGIQLLEDESILIDHKFYLVGRKDSSRSKKMNVDRKTPQQLTQNFNLDKPVILLDHQPGELQEAADAGVDLDLCGHTHDGQIFPGNMTVRFFWENPCGYLKKGQMHNIVTSGAGIWGPDMRVGTDSEICSITLNFQ
jgi:hypothetical protein